MSKSEIQLGTLNGERGVPSVNEHNSTAQRGVIVVILVLIALLAVGAVYFKRQHDANLAAKKEQQTKSVVGSTVPDHTFADPPPLSASAPAAASPPASAAAVPAPTPLPGDVRPPDPVLDKSASNLMVGGEMRLVDSSGTPGTDSAAAAAPGRAATAGNAGGSGGLGGSGGGALSSLLSSTSTPKRLAGYLGNRNFIIAKGSFIDCALQTRLDSTIPGMTSCVVTRNIYSDNGKVLLIERGSTISGEYQSNLRQGMARIFVLWSRIKTPNGIIINIDSPGTDPLGGAGLPGYVDNHFWERFGAALLLSMVDDATSYATQRGSSNTNINFGNTSDAMQNVATEALKNTIDIPPTLYKNQGEQVSVYVARDLDFSSVYSVSTDQ